MNTPTKTALIRFARVLIFGALASGVAWLMANIGMVIPEAKLYRSGCHGGIELYR